MYLLWVGGWVYLQESGANRRQQRQNVTSDFSESASGVNAAAVAGPRPVRVNHFLSSLYEDITDHRLASSVLCRQRGRSKIGSTSDGARLPPGAVATLNNQVTRSMGDKMSAGEK